MNRFALLSLYRSLIRHKLYAALNIGGLAVGIAVFLVLGLYVRFETSFERWLPNHDRIYLVETVWDLPGSPFNGPSGETMGDLLTQLREDFPGTVGTRWSGGRNGGSVLRNGVATQEDVAQVDASFFDVFDLPMVRGSGRQSLATPSGAVISESLAKRYFGSSDPIGQTMTIVGEGPQRYRVTGIFRDLPKNSEMQATILIRLPRNPPNPQWTHWGSTSLATYLRFDTPAAARAYEQRLPAFVDRRATHDMGPSPSKSIAIALMPLDDVHLAPNVGEGTRLTVVTLGLVGLLTLLIAMVNYVNLATARAGLRAREVAMRKVLGADRGALIRQFLGEAVLTAGLAALLGLILAELGLPLVNAAGGLSLTIPYAVVVPALVALAVVIGIAAGFYPAVLLARVPAAAVLASARAPGGGRAGTRVREALVVFQFGLAIAFMIGTAVLVAQTRYVRNADVGYPREGLIIVPSLADPQIGKARAREILATLRALPGVTAIGTANATVGGSGSSSSDNVPLPGVAGSGPSLNWVDVGPGFFDTYGITPVAGRLFDDAHAADNRAKQNLGVGVNILISRKAVTTLGFRSPQEAIGKTVGGDRPRTIVGVVPDIRFVSPHDPIAATYYYYTPDPLDLSYVTVTSLRFTGDPRAMLAQVRQVWQRMAPQVPFGGKTADERLARFYAADDRATRLFGIGAGLAVLIGCVGLWGLASFNTQRRVKEIGIRKTLGASSADIVRLLVGQFLRPVLVANLVAWPLAYLAMRTWLAGFDDRIALSPLYFVAASLIATAIAVLTVLGQSLRASRAAPAWALRHE
ncbi:ABC transporter permease [Sphingomonas sp. CV7422]|uniref:ABC transporter permease n=1 Tax=Sphingomonas sp. CV7422 TaxID=3018036 RepID=UPI0022FE29DD|nr:ABC transporter permease [Sphingomonas sp. CV7422]